MQKTAHIVGIMLADARISIFFFDKKNIEINENVQTVLENVQKEPLQDLTVSDENVNELLFKFKVFHSEVVTGIHGKTQQFCGLYIQFVDYYLLVERSVRMGHLELFCYILPKITNLSFIFNQMNDARWLVWYHNALLNVDETHPGLKNDLLIGVKRTDKPFSKIPLDLTLEQTINADAARRLTGIMHLTNSITARKKWSINHGLRSTIISHVLTECGLKNKQDVTNDLQHNRIQKSIDQRDKFINSLNNHMNPFSNEALPHILCNVATGQAATDAVANFLLNVPDTGEVKRNEMISSCYENEENFQKYVIKRNNVLNFASCIKPKKVTIAGKTQEVKLQRDLFGRLLGISLDAKIDMAKI